MGYRIRKSFKIAPGVRVNVGRKSVGISAGVRGARISTNTRSGTRATVGIPGSGLSYTAKVGGKKRPVPSPGGQATTVETDGTNEKIFTGYTIACAQCGTEQELPAFSDPATVFNCVGCNCTFALSPELQAQLVGPSARVPVPRTPPPPRIVSEEGQCLECNKINLPAAKRCSKCGAKLFAKGAAVPVTETEGLVAWFLIAAGVLFIVGLGWSLFAH